MSAYFLSLHTMKIIVAHDVPLYYLFGLPSDLTDVDLTQIILGTFYYITQLQSIVYNFFYSQISTYFNEICSFK